MEQIERPVLRGQVEQLCTEYGGGVSIIGIYEAGPEVWGTVDEHGDVRERRKGIVVLIRVPQAAHRNIRNLTGKIAALSGVDGVLCEPLTE